MRIEGNNPFIPALQQGAVQPAENSRTNSFAGVLKNALGEVSRLQAGADEAARQLAMGQAEDIHQVMIAVEEAKMAMQLTVQIRNKVVEAYQEISRMQI